MALLHKWIAWIIDLTRTAFFKECPRNNSLSWHEFFTCAACSRLFKLFYLFITGLRKIDSDRWRVHVTLAHYMRLWSRSDLWNLKRILHPCNCMLRERRSKIFRAKELAFHEIFFQTKEALQLLKLVYTVHGKLRVTCKIQFWQNYGPNPLFITYMLTLSSRQLQLAQSRSENHEHPTATQDVIHGHLRTSAAIPCGIWSWVPLEADPSMLRGYQSSGCQNTSVALWHNGFWVGLTADFGNNHKETTLRFKMMLYHLMNRQNRTNKMEKKQSTWKQWPITSWSMPQPCWAKALNTTASEYGCHCGEDQHQPWPPSQGRIAST